MVFGIGFGALSSSSSHGLPPIGLPTRSLSFTSASSQSLSISNANWGSYNRAKFAVSLWFKRQTDGANQALLVKGDNSSGTTEFDIRLLSSNALDIKVYDGSGGVGVLRTNNAFTSGIWHQMLFWYDSSNSTAGDRMKLWTNGSEETSFSVDTNPTLPAATTSQPVGYGVLDAGGTPSQFMNGLIYQPAFYSGVLPTISQVWVDLGGGNQGARDVSGISGLYSLLNTDATTSLEDDYVLSANWTNTNTVIKSVTIP